ncbi:MAG: exonuclease SbcCD subunit D [Candidatus Nanohaloarchaea archaeon]
MRILHTADVHLSTDHPERTEALEEVLKKAEKEDADLLTISGDLFDSPEDAEKMRPRVRELFSGNSFPVVAIPGNHDSEVYRDSKNFGEDIDVLVDQPLDSEEVEEESFTGVPFRSEMDEELFSALKQDGSDVLLLHCTIDGGFHSDDCGDENLYFPVDRSTLSELDYSFILAGHIHSRDREIALENGTFIYPGSPVSVSSSEEGKRHAVLVDTEDESVSPVELDSFYHDSFRRTISPGEAGEVLEELERWVSRREDDRCSPEIVLDGFTEMEEQDFSERLEEATGDFEPEDRTRSAAEVMDHPLYRRFTEKMESREAEEGERAREQVIEVLSDLIVSGEVKPE